MAHTYALRPPNAPVGRARCPGGQRRPGRFCSARSASRRPGSPRLAWAARRPRGHVQPRQHM